jgi:MFS transporter, DHA1 family, multidrug resistance protein
MCIGREHVGDRCLAICASFRRLGCAHVVQAMVRDLYDRNESARVLSLNMLVTASAPVIAPLIGGQVLLWFDWRAIFWVLAIFGVVSVCAALVLPETLAASRRNEAHPVAMLLGYFQLDPPPPGPIWRRAQRSFE